MRIGQRWACVSKTHPDREFFLLSALGRDLPGAVTVSPADNQPWPDEARSALPGQASSAAAEQVLRFSLAGVQLKFSAVMGAHGGLTIPAQGIGGHWIVKLPSPEFDHVPENEFSMMTLAGMVGIDVPAFDLVNVASIDHLPGGVGQLGNQAFVIERFDRADDDLLVHVEDFAQVFDVYPKDKYRDQRHAALAPAYDFVSTIAYIPGDKSALKFSRSREFTDYTFDELEHLATKATLPRRLVLDTTKETIALFMQHWATEKMHLPMDRHVRQCIDKHLETLPILSM